MNRPTDAYSRVTEPERFRPLINWALEAVARLQTEYEVTLDEGEGMDAELELAPLSRPTIRLTPLQDSCAPITIAFTDFPALGVRVGRWVTDFFPYCGCDACDEMPEEEIERFTELLSDVVARPVSRIRAPAIREDGWSSREFWPDEHRSCGESRVATRQSVSNRGRARRKLFWRGCPGSQNRTIRPPVSQSGPPA